MAQSTQIKDRTSNANLSINSDGSINSVVSGTVTATPTGTQTVSGTVTIIPSGTQTITGTVTATPTGTQVVSGTVSTFPYVAPGTNYYTTSFSALVGQTAATYNYLSLFNPGGSGKTVTIQASLIIPWASAAATGLNSMETFRTTAASAGTLLAAASINKFDLSAPTSVVEIRTANPTITTAGLTLGGIPPILTSVSAGLSGIGNIAVPSGSSFILPPGNGVCMRQVVAGDVDQLWNLGYIWSEV